MSLDFTVDGRHEPISLTDPIAVVAGYTGRDEAGVRHHIDELAAIGVAPPPEIPMFYVVEATSVGSEAAYPQPSALTSGEVEPVYIRHRGHFYLGVGSDHTDRDLETVDIGQSKRACPKPVGRTVVAIPDINDVDLDRAVARCFVDDDLYQEGTLDGLRTPGDVVQRLVAKLGVDDSTDFICLGGTLPLLGGEFRRGSVWRMELDLGDGVHLSHTYRMEGK